MFKIGTQYEITGKIREKSESLSKYDRFILLLFAIYFAIYFCIPTSSNPVAPYFMGMIIIILFIAECLLRRKILHLNKLALILLGIGICNLGTFFVGSDMVIGKVFQSIINIGIIGIVITSYCDTKTRLIELLKTIFWTGFAGGSIIGIYQMITGSYLYFVPDYDVSLTFVSTVISTATKSNSNYSALQFVSIGFIGLYLTTVVQKRSRIYLIMTIISFLCVGLTFSRTAIAATGIALLLYFFLKMKVKGVLKRGIVIVFIGTLVFFVMLLFGINFGLESFLNPQGLEKILETKSGTGNFINRFEQWGASFELMINSSFNNLVFGYGNSYISKLSEYGSYMSTHNTIIEQFVAKGFIAGLLFVIAIILAFRYYAQALKNKRENSALLCGYIAIFITIQMISTFYLEVIIYLFIAGVIKNIGAKEKNEYGQT